MRQVVAALLDVAREKGPERAMLAMWLALHGSPGWPSGRVDVQGLPF